ncbi:ThiF family adenylyltransferase [uncultured Campylobacter sp.]|uniref:tRNA threonylcarbamoyladenosine dehydratase n=1 Tax=uncultured Campylobacter sp. TaxID=218934 RepID=UPI00261F5154|nr:ThiF family adenylyltransferase [uncultured Campylobacter sp.]
MSEVVVDRFSRSRLLFGEDFARLQSAKILICGCGGVGGAAIEALYRSGAVNLSVIDCDRFEITNQNRQLGSECLGELKCEVFARKFKGVTPIVARIDEEFLSKFDLAQFDFVIDAIDDAGAKIALALRCSEAGAGFISSMGGAKRLDPSKIEIRSIWRTQGDPLARKIRYELRKRGFAGDFDVVCSSEPPRVKSMGSFMGVTASFGLFIASYVVRKLISKQA